MLRSFCGVGEKRLLLALFRVCLCGLFFMHFLTVWSEKKRFWLKKILKAFHRSHFLNSLSPFSSLSSVFVGFGEKFKKSKSRQKRTLIKTLSASYHHTPSTTSKSSSSQQNALIIQRKRGSKTTPHHHQNNNFNFNFNNNSY